METEICKDCNGYGAEGFEDRPGCYVWVGECRTCRGTGRVVVEGEEAPIRKRVWPSELKVMCGTWPAFTGAAK